MALKESAAQTIRCALIALAIVSAVMNFLVYRYLSDQNPIFLMYVAGSVLVAVALAFPRLRGKLWPSRGRSPGGRAHDGGERSP